MTAGVQFHPVANSCRYLPQPIWYASNEAGRRVDLASNFFAGNTPRQKVDATFDRRRTEIATPCDPA
jgi:hypothetical protein